MKNAKLSEFTPDPRNANKGTERGRGMLEKSLQDLGAGRSVLADKHGVLIAGNKTLQTAVEAGFEDAIVVESDGTRLVIVKRTDLDLSTDEKAKRLAIADNRVGEISLEWDADVLAELNQEVDLSGLFYPDELSALLDSLQQEQPTAEEDEETTADLIEQAEAGAIESRVSLGQIWKIGRHFIACGDSTDEGNVRKLLGDRKPAMVFCDPPYGISIVATNVTVGGGEAYDIPFGGVKNREKGYVGGVTATEPQSKNADGGKNRAKKPKGLAPPMEPSPSAQKTQMLEEPSVPLTLSLSTNMLR